MIISEELGLDLLQSEMSNLKGQEEIVIKYAPKDSSHSGNINTLMFEQDEIDSNQYLVTKPTQNSQKIEQNQQHNKSSDNLVSNSLNNPPQKQNICKAIIDKCKRFSQKKQSLQNSYKQYQQWQEKYVQRIKIIYSHFLVKDSNLTLKQIQQLKSLLFVPKYGESIVQWGNAKYGFNFTLLTALQRLNNMQILIQRKKCRKRCSEQLQVLVILILLLIVIKLIS